MSRIRTRAALWLMITSIPAFGISFIVFGFSPERVGMLRPLIAVLAALLVISIAVGWVAVLSPVLRRVNRSVAIAELVADGDVDARVAALETDEVGHLGRAVDELAGRIDASERRRGELEERLRHQATHDRLTGLVNREHAVQLLTAKLSALDRRSVTVDLIDIDDFRLVNEMWGTAVADEVLVTIGSRLRRVIGDNGLAARWGADEFMLITTNVDTATRTSIIEGVGAVFDEPVNTSAGHQLIAASVGRAAGTSGETTADALVQAADEQLGRAKSAAARSQRLAPAIAELVEAALDGDSLEVWFQPIVRVLSPTETRLVGAEALVRLRHDGHLHPAADFLAEIVTTRYAGEIDQRVASMVFDHLVSWSDRGLASDFFVSLNLSPASLRDAEIADSLLAGCQARGVDPSCIVLDVSEEAGELDQILAADLRQSGFRLAIDDLGFKRSNFDRLFTVGAAFAKLHRRWLNDPVVLDALIKICHGKGLQVIAEGVETMDQLGALSARGVEYCQGYLISRPIEPEAFARLLGAGRPGTSAKEITSPAP